MKWRETRREYEIVNNEEILKKITREHVSPLFSPKEVADYVVKFLGLFSLVAPFYLFYRQQAEENIRQRSLFELEILTEASSQIYKLTDLQYSDPTHIQAANQFFYVTKPKVNLLKKENLNSLLDSIQTAHGLAGIFHRLSDTLGHINETLDMLMEDFSSFNYRFRSFSAEDVSQIIKNIQTRKNRVNNELDRNDLLQSVRQSNHDSSLSEIEILVNQFSATCFNVIDSYNKALNYYYQKNRSRTAKDKILDNSQYPNIVNDRYVRAVRDEQTKNILKKLDDYIKSQVNKFNNSAIESSRYLNLSS
ncbi:hypothetical protein [Pollutibacter soli]|uniref:hypothetical protein n=1 Tax=Pollutibacter soli TaxID=3034157 RepID=UPI003013988C